jgi:hypothetical protein
MSQYLLGGRYISTAQQFWTDRNSGARMDLATCSPVQLPTDQNWWIPGVLAIGAYDQPLPDQLLILCSHPDYRGDAIQAPSRYDYVWGEDGGTALYRTVAPAGYTALSDMFNMNVGSHISGGGGQGCIINAAVVPAPISGLIWNDKHSGAEDDGSVWGIDDGTPGAWSHFVAVSGYGQPGGAWKVNMDLVEMI